MARARARLIVVVAGRSAPSAPASRHSSLVSFVAASRTNRIEGADEDGSRTSYRAYRPATTPSTSASQES